MKNLFFALTVVFTFVFSLDSFAQFELLINGSAKAHKSVTVEENISSSTFSNKSYGQPIKLKIGTLTVEIKKANNWALFDHNLVGFSFRKTVNFSKHIYPLNNTATCGTSGKKWVKGYFKNLYNIVGYSLSDRSTKENFRNISNPLSIVMQLEGQLYDYKPEVFMPKNEEETSEVSLNVNASAELKKMEQEAEKSRKNHYGFIAQDVKEILPDAVEYNEETGLHSMNYVAIIPILVESIKEQQKQIEELKALIEEK